MADSLDWWDNNHSADFSVLDFWEAFYHIELERAEDPQLCSFIIRWDIFTIGTAVGNQGGSTDHALSDGYHSAWAPDDIIVFSQTYRASGEFQSDQSAQRIVKASKTKLTQPEVKYCGFRVNHAQQGRFLWQCWHHRYFLLYHTVPTLHPHRNFQYLLVLWTFSSRCQYCWSFPPKLRVLILLSHFRSDILCHRWPRCSWIDYRY